MPESRLNPRITEAEIGIRDLRNIKLYPLSMADQLEMTDIITSALTQLTTDATLLDGGDEGNRRFVAFLTNLIRENLGRILVKVCACSDEDVKVILSDVDNTQFLDIVEKIFDMNYGPVIKNARSLFDQKIKTMFQSERPLVTSVKDTDTNLNTFTNEAGKTEE